MGHTHIRLRWGSCTFEMGELHFHLIWEVELRTFVLRWSCLIRVGGEIGRKHLDQDPGLSLSLVL